MEKKEQLYEGKAKKVFATDDANLVIVDYKDDATAFNGEKKGTITGKGVINNVMSNHMFQLLEQQGVPTHFVEQLSECETLVKKVSIVPLEVIIRNISAGSFAKRFGVEEGIVFDEPTSSLTETEVEHLFRIINMLRDKGCGIIYISHKMEEILRISDDVTIMRDGTWVATRPAKELTMDEIIRLMVGRELTNRFPPKDNVPGEVILEVEHLSGKYTRLKEPASSSTRARSWALPVWTAPAGRKCWKTSSAP